MGECYILASHYVTIREILRLAHEVSGHREVRRMLPLWVAKAFAPLVGLYYRLRGQKPVVSAYALYTLNSNGDFSHEKASRELGYQPRPFRDTVRDTIHWLKDQGLIRFKYGWEGFFYGGEAGRHGAAMAQVPGQALHRRLAAAGR